MSNPATFRNAISRQGPLLGTFLVTTVGFAAIMPGLILQGVATRPRALRPDDDAAVDPAPGRAAPTVAETTVPTASNGRVQAGAALEGAAADGSTGSGHRPHRPRAKPAAPRAGREADRAANTERLGGRQQPLSASDAGPASTAGSAPPVAAFASVASGGAEPIASGLAVAEPEADGAVEQTTPDGETRSPVAFEEVQAAHAAAARSFRDMRNSLNEAYRIIGRLNVERYEALMELAELKGTPLPERPPDRSWKSAAKPSALPGPRPTAPAAARRLKRNRELEEEDQVDPAEVMALGRRRQRMVVGSIAAVVLLAVVYRLSGANWLPNLLDRQAITDMAAIGVFMQVFFLVFFLVRLTTLTGKGKNWLFPTPEEEAWKQRRKRVRGR